MKKIDEKIAIKSLKQISELFNNHDIEYWLDFGTLLGAVRDGKIIEWDSDIDLSVWYKDYLKVGSVCLKLKDIGFNVYFNTKSEIAISKNLCRITINFYESLDNKAVKDFSSPKNFLGKFVQLITNHLNSVLVVSDHSDVKSESKIIKIISKISMKTPNKIKTNFVQNMLKKVIYFFDKKISSSYIYSEVPIHFFNDFKTIKFYGMEFKVPAKTEKYLEFRYGKDWRIPRKDYIFQTDDCTIKTK